jgi:hypothetical protein
MGTLRQLVDSAELFWGRWVVEYNASQQILLAQRLGQRLGFSGRSFVGGHRGTGLTRRQALVVAGIVMLAIVISSQRKRLLGWRKGRRTGDKGQHGEVPIARVYHATVKRLAAAGLPRRPWETPHEYLARLENAPLEGAAVLARLTELYASACYGDVEIPPDVVATIRSECGRIDVSP